MLPDFPHINDLNLRLDSQLYLYSNLESSKIVTIDEVYAIKITTKIRLTNFATFGKASSSFLHFNKESIWNRRKNFHKAEIIGAYVATSKFNVINGATYEGPFLDIFTSLGDVANFTVKFSPSPDGQYGAISGNSTNWNGMVGMIQRREADVIPHDLSGMYIIDISEK